MTRILLIEPDPPLREIVGRMLADAGYEVVPAKDGVEGLRLWHAGQTDLALTEVIMPETGGIEVMLKLRTFAPTLPIVAMATEVREIELLAEVQLLGSIALLTKPFSVAELLATVRAALGRDPPTQHTEIA
jgi:DNA-binding response OmpR family regulator